jgi:phage terminase Nu1 subunit (DNA packaging protein)
MIKTILTLIITILKNKNYYTEAKKIWSMVDENFRISATVEEKVKSKADEFSKALLAKFPELSQTDIDILRQSIAGEINKNKDAVINNSDLLIQLQAENVSLKNQLSQVQAAVASNPNTGVQQVAAQA